MTRPPGKTWVLERWQIELIQMSSKSTDNTRWFAERFGVSVDTVRRVQRGEIVASALTKPKPVVVEKCHEDYMHHPFNG